MSRFTIVLITVFIIAGSTYASDFSKCTVGVQGYDLVSYHTGKKPLRGTGNHISVYKKVTYLFVSEKNKQLFLKAPEKYVPAYGGYCAYGVSVGKKFVGDPDVWKVVDGKLYFNLDTKIQEIWRKEVDNHIKKANDQWQKIESIDPQKL